MAGAAEAAAARAAAAGGERRALVVILGGVVAALHVGKLPSAVTALQAALQLTLVEAGFLLSLVQFAGMSAGLAFGALADALGLRRALLIGLVLLAAASAAGGAAQSAAALMVLRAVEGCGFLLVVLAAPPLVRRLVPPARLARALGVWGAYMPLATALALLAGPFVIGAVGWRGWWWSLAALTAAMAIVVARAVPAGVVVPPMAAALPWRRRIGDTLTASGPWLVALIFAVYSAQWLAVIGFLPTIYHDAGVGTGTTAVLTALAAGVNIVGNVAAGRLLYRGVAPVRLLCVGFAVMGTAAFVTFTAALPVPAALRYAAVLAFSMVGGVIPATLFAVSMRVAPGEHTLSSTVGWMQQWSSLGQFGSPPLVAWLAGIAGGWHWTWRATGAFAAAGVVLAVVLGRRLARTPR